MADRAPTADVVSVRLLRSSQLPPHPVVMVEKAPIAAPRHPVVEAEANAAIPAEVVDPAVAADPEAVADPTVAALTTSPLTIFPRPGRV